LMAAVGVVTLVLMPIVKGLWFLRTDLPAGPGSGHWQTQFRAIFLLLLVIGFIGFAPVPERRVITGVVWMADIAQVKTQGDGFVDRVLTTQGQVIENGAGVVQLSDPAAETYLQRLFARREGALSLVAQSMVTDIAKSRQYQLDLEQIEREIAVESEKQVDRVARAQVAGPVFVKDAADIAGKYFKRGEILGFVLTGASADAAMKPVVRVAVEQDDVALLKGRVLGVELQIAGDGSRAYTSRLLRDVPSALLKLPSAALGDRGGGELTIDPQDKDGLRTARPTYAFDVAMPDDAMQSSGRIGQKAFVRFDLGNAPLASQWLRRAQQTVLLKFAPRDI
jgi:putative peptide zinc metalloprotease protein